MNKNKLKMGKCNSIKSKEAPKGERPNAASNEHPVQKIWVSKTQPATDLTAAEVSFLVSSSNVSPNFIGNFMLQNCPVCFLPSTKNLCTLQKCGHVYHKPCLLSKISQNSNSGVNKKALCIICEITQPNSDSFMDEAQILDVPLNLEDEMNFMQTQKVAQYLKFRAEKKSALDTH